MFYKIIKFKLCNERQAQVEEWIRQRAAALEIFRNSIAPIRQESNLLQVKIFKNFIFFSKKLIKGFTKHACSAKFDGTIVINVYTKQSTK